MRNIILAFGSLVTDKRNLKIRGEWNNDGAVIPIEFCRISNGGRLTPVVKENGGLCQTYWAESEFENLENTLRNFEEREGIERNRVSYINVRNGRKSESCNRHPNIANTVLEWARSKGFIENVIFCGLGPKFKDVLDLDYSIENALQYLVELEGETRLDAIKYLLNIPSQTLTPFMREFRSRFSISFSEPNEE